MAVIRDNIITFSGAIQHRRGSADTLSVSDYVPLAGELLVATDTGDIRVGDGVHSWAELPTPNKEILQRISALETFNGIDCGEISAPINNG